MSIKKVIKFSTTITFLLILFACNKNNDEILEGTGTANVKINIKSPTFGDEQNLNLRAISSEPDVQVQQIKFNEKFVLEAKLSNTSSSTMPTLRGQSTTELGQNVKYRLLIYDPITKTAPFFDYKYGSEESLPPLKLDGGKTYTFIAYSVNSTTELPNHSYNGRIEDIRIDRFSTGLEDFMLFRKEMKVVKGNNYLDIDFKHMFSQVTVSVDANPVNMNISEISRVSLDNREQQFGFFLDRQISYFPFGHVKDITNVSFPAGELNSKLITSDPATYYPFNNASNYSTTLNIGSITVGNNTKTNLSFSGFSIRPENRYKLTITLKPNETDAVGLYLNTPAVKIAGRVWARHNISESITSTLDPDSDKLSNLELGGYMYTWGYNEPMGHVATSGKPINYLSLIAVNKLKTSWNLNEGLSETASKNIASDPCPSGFRVPTKNEFQDLLNATNKSTDGLLTNKLILTSKTKSNIKLTFPAAGSKTSDPNLNTYELNNMGYYHTSTPNEIDVNLAWCFNFSKTNVQLLSNFSKKNARSIRCIADKSDYIKLDLAN